MDRKIISFLTENHAWTNIYGTARSLLALGTLLTFLTTKTDVLFVEIGSRDGFCDVLQISLFCMVDNFLISKLIAIFILILVVIGWRPQMTSIFHCWIMYSFANSATILDGGDHIGLIISLLILPISLTDKRKWHWSKSIEVNHKSTFYGVKNLIALSSLLVIRIQVAIIYLNSAVAKINVDEWMNGTAIYYWFKHPVFGYPSWLNFILEPLILNGTSLFIICWGTILFEFTLFSGLFMDKRLKKYILIGGIFFHFGIFIIHGLASFFFTMTACLILYLKPINSHINFNIFHSLKNKIYDSFFNSGSISRSSDADN